MFVLGDKADIVAEHSQDKQAVWIGTNALIFSLLLCDQSECFPDSPKAVASPRKQSSQQESRWRRRAVSLLGGGIELRLV